MDRVCTGDPSVDGGSEDIEIDGTDVATADAVGDLPLDVPRDVQEDVGEDVAADMADADAAEDASEDAADMGPDVPPAPAVVEVEPGSIDFGEVGLFASVYRQLVVRNGGDEPLTIHDVRLRTPESVGFVLQSPVRLPYVVPPRFAVIWDVAFQPMQLRGDRPTNYGNFVLVETSDEQTGVVEVALEGVAVADPMYCLAFDRSFVDLGYISPNNVRSARLELRNCGLEPAVVPSIQLVDMPETSVTTGSPLPVELDPDEMVAVVVTYTPSEVRLLRGLVIARDDFLQETRVQIVSAPACPVSVVTASVGEQTQEDRIGATVGQPVRLSGAGSSDEAEGDLEFSWRIDAPDSSDDLRADPGLDVEELEFTPDVPGTYSAHLSVTSQRSGLVSCEEDTVVIDAFPDVAKVEIALTWNNGADLDLHMVRRVDGEFSGYGNGQSVEEDDCYFNNMNPDWGRPGDPVDNPRLLGDDTDGEGPETIVFPVLNASQRYRIGINYARRLNTETSEATVVVKVDGEEAGRWTETLSEQGMFWVPTLIDGDGGLLEP